MEKTLRELPAEISQSVLTDSMSRLWEFTIFHCGVRASLRAINLSRQVDWEQVNWTQINESLTANILRLDLATSNVELQQIAVVSLLAVVGVATLVIGGVFAYKCRHSREFLV